MKSLSSYVEWHALKPNLAQIFPIFFSEIGILRSKTGQKPVFRDSSACEWVRVFETRLISCTGTYYIGKMIWDTCNYMQKNFMNCFRKKIRRCFFWFFLFSLEFGDFITRVYAHIKAYKKLNKTGFLVFNPTHKLEPKNIILKISAL